MTHTHQAFCITSLAAAFVGSPARAQSAPNSVSEVEISSDWEGSELIRNLGTSYGTGTVGGHAASVTTMHLERICRLPCEAKIPTEGKYFVDGPGMHTREFELAPGTESARLRVQGAPQWPITLSAWTAWLGGSLAFTGGLLWAISSGDDDVGSLTKASQTMTFVGVGALAAGIVGLVFLPKTHVDRESGERLDARNKPRPGVRFVGNGVLF